MSQNVQRAIQAGLIIGSILMISLMVFMDNLADSLWNKDLEEVGAVQINNWILKEEFTHEGCTTWSYTSKVRPKRTQYFTKCK